MSNNHNPRQNTRKETNTVFKIYSNIVRGKYTVKLKNISKKGAFIQTKYYPEVDEIISFSIVDKNDKEKFMGNARVVWCKKDGLEQDRGFGIELDEELQDDILVSLKDF